MPNTPFDRTLIAWNGSRESARALAEATPYLYEAKANTVVVVDEEHPTDLQALIGLDAVKHLQHHGIDARLHRVRNRMHDVAASRRGRLRRRLLDGTVFEKVR